MNVHADSRCGRRSEHDRRGFALIIVVALLALLVLALVSLATLTRIETQVGANSRKQAQARQNARFALDVALGELQRAAGPDRRITGTAELNSVSNANRNWTRVWDATDGNGITWLVSGNQNGEIRFLPDDPPTGLDVGANATTEGITVRDNVSSEQVEARVLVGPNSAGANVDRYVVVPVRELEGPAADGSANVTVGRYAWWVGDEGVKARANTTDPYASFDPDSAEGRLRHRVMQRVDGSQVTSLALPVNEPSLSRVLMTPQYSLAGPTTASLRAHFFDVTAVSRGLLADAANGGLKLDLSPFLAGYASGALPTGTEPFASISLGELQDWGAAAAGQSGEGFGAVADASVAMHPIIIRQSYAFGLFRTQADPHQIRLFAMPIFAVWNPFTVGLRGDYQIDVNLPLQFQVFEQQPGPTNVLLGTFNFVGDVAHFAIRNMTLLPGECRLFAASNWSEYSTGASATQLGGVWSNQRGIYSPNAGVMATSESSRVALSQSGAAPLSSFFVALNFVTGGGDVQAIQEVSGASGFSGYAPQTSVDFAALPVVATGTRLDAGTNVIHQHMVAHGWRLQHVNEPVWVPINHETTLAGTSPYIEVNSVTPTPDPGYQRAYTGWDWTSSGGGQTFSTLYDAPHRESAASGARLMPLSLVELRHVRGNSQSWEPRLLFDRPATLGDPAPSYGPALWDRFFLSGIEQWSASTGLTALPNSHMTVTRPIGRPFVPGEVNTDAVSRSAASLLVEGAFNVNSTSASAWAAILRSGSTSSSPSTPAGIPVANGSGAVDPVAQLYPFARFAFPRFAALGAPVPTSPEAWGGYRRLTAIQMDALVERIVFRVKARLLADGPFRSLASFIEEGLIQHAIDDVDASGGAAQINPTTPSPWANIARGTSGATIPGVLTQWDVLSPLLPILTVRSDTFLVRAYGETVNSVTDETEARAWCEAVVQRRPEYVDTTLDPWATPAVGSPNEKFGRRFVITSFRWLSPDDI